MKSNYLRLLLSRWLCTFGAILQSVALPIIIFDFTGATQLLSITFIFETIPWLFITPFITPLIVRRFSIKSLYIMCNFFRAAFTLLLAFVLHSSIFTIGVFFVLGILNSLIASLYGTLIKNTARDKSIHTILGLSMGIDDVISILAPLVVAIAVGNGINCIIFIYCNATFLLLSAVFSFTVVYVQCEIKKSIHEPIKKVLLDTVYSFRTLLEPKIVFLVVSESVRSFVEGMCIPLLISYVVTVLNADESVFTTGQVLGAIAQVAISVVYIYLSKRCKPERIIVGGGVLMMFAFLSMAFELSPTIYLVSMVVLGSGMAIRQLIGESVFISSFDESAIAKKLPAFNSIIALFYLLGYIVSYVMPYILSLKMIMALGAFLLVVPMCMMGYKNKEGESF